MPSDLDAGLKAPPLAMPLSWRHTVAAPALVVGLIAILLLFNEEAGAAVKVWIDSTAYGHCFFIIPIAGFLAWERRFAAMATPIQPMPWAALLAIPMGLVWLGVERLGIMEGQQIMAMGFVELLFLVVLGWRMCWVLAVPLLYLGFLVPFGAFLTSPLQDFTARFIDVGLNVLGIPHFSDARIIEIPEGAFFVAEACAGLRFLIASIAFGALYACMIYRSAGRRICFMVASIIIPIIANGFRGLGIVYLGHLLGSAEAAAVDHIVYGWVFFSFVILVLIVAGLPFRQDAVAIAAPAGALPPAPPRTASVWMAACAALVLTAMAPVGAGWLDRRGHEIAVPPSAPVLANCVAQGAAVVHEGHYTWTYACRMGLQPVDALTLVITAFPPNGNPGVMGRIQRGSTGELNAEDASASTLLESGSAVWRMVTTSVPDSLTAVSEWIDGAPAPGGFVQRRLLAWHSVFGGERAQVLMTIGTASFKTRLSPQALQEGRSAILALLARNPNLSAQMDQLARQIAQ